MTVTWSATGDSNGTEETNTGSVAFTKVNPNAAIYCYFTNIAKAHYPQVQRSTHGHIQEQRLLCRLVLSSPMTVVRNIIQMTVPSSTTAITLINSDSHPTDKEAYFTLSGQRISQKPATSGVYIHNKKKVGISYFNCRFFRRFSADRGRG